VRTWCGLVEGSNVARGDVAGCMEKRLADLGKMRGHVQKIFKILLEEQQCSIEICQVDRKCECSIPLSKPWTTVFSTLYTGTL
jgi:hypothetical protein